MLWLPKLIITKTKVIATNPNRAMFHGPLDVQAFSPYAKNPTIRKFFTAFGSTDEIGSGVRNVVKFLRYYTPAGTPLFLEDDVFKTENSVGTNNIGCSSATLS